MMDNNSPVRFPVRKLGSQWEVLIVDENRWLPCRTENDARKISRAPILYHASLERTRRGPKFALELEEVADALFKYRIEFGSVFFRRCAELARSVS